MSADKDDLKDAVKQALVEALAASLEAQLRAVRRLHKKPDEAEERPEKRLSQVDMVYAILIRAGHPMHISRIMEEVERLHGVRLSRESIVSSLGKKVARGERFVRTDRNTFGILEGGQ